MKIKEIDQRIQVEDLKKQIEDMNKRISSNKPCEEDNLKSLWAELKKYSVMMEKHNTMIQKVAFKTEQNEQYTRRENLRFFGIPEREKENTSELLVELAGSIGVDLTTADISVSHRLGTPRKEKGRDSSVHTPRPIIAKFVRREKRDEILRNKSKLQWKRPELLEEGEFNIFINDDLTQARSIIRKALSNQPDKVKVGTANGKLLYTFTNNGFEKTVSIDSPMDLIRKLDWSMDYLSSLGLCVDGEDFIDQE